MTQQSRVIFENQHYVACVTKAGLSVQNKHQNRGKLLLVNTKAFWEWLVSFDDAIAHSNATECNAFCRAIFQCAS